MRGVGIESLKVIGLVAVAAGVALALVPCRPWSCGRAAGIKTVAGGERSPDAGHSSLSSNPLAGHVGIDKPIAWRDVVRSATGHEVLAADMQSPKTRELIAILERAAESVIARFNAADSPARGLARINEASRFLEDWLAEAIDAAPDWRCRPPRTARGTIQRSGYPDLEVRHVDSDLIAYLDPKLFAADSLDSTLRTFYYSPGGSTGKIHEDALHLVLGFQHDGNKSAWRITGWHLVDLARIQVDAKLEFNASNRALYAPAAMLRRRLPEPPPPGDGLPEPSSSLD